MVLENLAAPSSPGLSPGKASSPLAHPKLLSWLYLCSHGQGEQSWPEETLRGSVGQRVKRLFRKVWENMFMPQIRAAPLAVAAE